MRRREFIALLSAMGVSRFVEVMPAEAQQPSRMARVETTMNEVKHRIVEANGIRMHLAEQGTGPLVVLCHGFPESWYSWRHQLGALADAGYRAVALDMRGYGRTSKPVSVHEYRMTELVADVVGVVHALGEGTAIVVGHDWGAPVAW